MGRRGQGERESSLVSSDALPALPGTRRVCAGRAVGFTGKQGGTAENVVSVLVPIGEQGLFSFPKGESHMLEKLPGKRWRRQCRR